MWSIQTTIQISISTATAPVPVLVSQLGVATGCVGVDSCVWLQIINNVGVATSHVGVVVRSCVFLTDETVVVVRTKDLGLEVGVSLACVTVFILLVALIVLSVLLVLYLRRRNRAKQFLLEQERQMQLMTSSSNTYFTTNFVSAMEELQQLGLEYNYACLEVIGELGEGAFGRVYKAMAPGLLQHSQHFVAVKSLKADASSDVLAALWLRCVPVLSSSTPTWSSWWGYALRHRSA